MKNLELKVSLDDPKNITKLIKQSGAKYHGKLRQVDTYFKYPNGRLKVREINNRQFELIYYLRDDKKDSKLSDYRIVKLTRRNFTQIKKILINNFGLKVIVKKIRSLWIYDHTRIHLDRVINLGNFLELETVMTNLKPLKAKYEHNAVINNLRLDNFHKIDKSYSDLLAVHKSY